MIIISLWPLPSRRRVHGNAHARSKGDNTCCLPCTHCTHTPSDDTCPHPALPACSGGRLAGWLAGLTGWPTSSLKRVRVTLRCHSRGTPAPLPSHPPLFRHCPIALWERHLPCPWLSTSKKRKKKKKNDRRSHQGGFPAW